MDDMCEAKGMDSMFEQMAAEQPDGPSADELKVWCSSILSIDSLAGAGKLSELYEGFNG